MSAITIPKVIKRFSEYYEEHITWGSLHVVLEDDNIGDASVKFCRQWAIEHGDTEGAELAEILLLLSKTQRKKLPRKVAELVREAKAT